MIINPITNVSFPEINALKPDALHARPTLAKEVLLVTIVLDNVDSVLFAPTILPLRNVNFIARKALLTALKLATKEKPFA